MLSVLPMRNGSKLLLLFGVYSFAISCNSQPVNHAYISEGERKITDSLKMDTSVVALLRKYTDSTIEPFHYSLSRQINPDGTEIELDPVHLQGIVFREHTETTEVLIEKLWKPLYDRGYTLFKVDQNYGIGNKPDVMGIAKTRNKYDILTAVQTGGVNYDIDNDSLLKIIKVFDNKYSLDLIGASGDYCEFIINKKPQNWLTMAKEAYKVCPDIVEQGANTVEALAREMKRTGRLYFWWD
jgi:hypothetical protein